MASFKDFIIKNIYSFALETKAQGAVEYILIAGAIIVAAIIFIPIYKEIAKTTAEKTNESVILTGKVTQNSVKEEIANL
jgi:hypothetical protein